MIDPFVYTLLYLLGAIPVAFIGLWFAGVFDRPKKTPPHLPAE